MNKKGLIPKTFGIIKKKMFFTVHNIDSSKVHFKRETEGFVENQQLLEVITGGSEIKIKDVTSQIHQKMFSNDFDIQVINSGVNKEVIGKFITDSHNSFSGSAEEFNFSLIKGFDDSGNEFFDVQDNMLLKLPSDEKRNKYEIRVRMSNKLGWGCEKTFTVFNDNSVASGSFFKSNNKNGFGSGNKDFGSSGNSNGFNTGGKSNWDTSTNEGYDGSTVRSSNDGSTYENSNDGSTYEDSTNGPAVGTYNDGSTYEESTYGSYDEGSAVGTSNDGSTYEDSTNGSYDEGSAVGTPNDGATYEDSNQSGTSTNGTNTEEEFKMNSQGMGSDDQTTNTLKNIEKDSDDKQYVAESSTDLTL